MNHIVSVPDACRACEGTGLTEDWDLCRSCGGDGEFAQAPVDPSNFFNPRQPDEPLPF